MQEGGRKGGENVPTKGQCMEVNRSFMSGNFPFLIYPFLLLSI